MVKVIGRDLLYVFPASKSTETKEEPSFKKILDRILSAQEINKKGSVNKHGKIV